VSDIISGGLVGHLSPKVEKNPGFSKKKQPTWVFSNPFFFGFLKRNKILFLF